MTEVGAKGGIKQGNDFRALDPCSVYHNNFPPMSSSVPTICAIRSRTVKSRRDLTNVTEEHKYKCAIMKAGSGGRKMLYCPECETSLDVEEDEVDEGEVLSCPECGTDFEVATINPVELKPVDEE